MNYPFDHIVLNGRTVNLNDIIAGIVNGADAFEQTTLAFIEQWYRGDPNFILTTSGSTGAPKEIIVTKEQMRASAKMTEHALGLRSGEVAFVCLDTKYIAGKMMLARSLTTGMKIVAQTPSVNPFIGYPDKIDFTAMVPSQIFEIVRSAEAPFLNHVSRLIVGGGAVNASLRECLQQYRCIFYATYGMTETISHVALQQLNGADQSDYFHALPGIQLSTDHRGCMVIVAPYLSEPVVTNDLVDLDSGKFKWLGRFDNIINSGGVKIIPEKVEEGIRKVFRSLELPHLFFISSLPDEKFGEKIVLFMEGQKINDVQQAALSQALRKHLNPYEIPWQGIILNTFEMTETSKINRFKSVQNSNKIIQKFTLKN